MPLILTLALSGALAAEGLWEDVDSRVAEVVPKLKVKVEQAVAEGAVVMVDISVPRFDRMLEPDALALDDRHGIVKFACMDPAGKWQYCWLDEGKRRMRLQFTTRDAEGEHTLHWFGHPVATFTVKKGTVSELPQPEAETSAVLDLRPPQKIEVVDVVELEIEGEPAPPGTRWGVVHARFSGAPPSLLGSTLLIDVDGLPVQPLVEACAVKKGPLDGCDPLPDKGDIHLLAALPAKGAEGVLVLGDASITEAFDLDALEVVGEDAVPAALIEAIPEVDPAEPITVLRAWQTELEGLNLWVDVRLDGEVQLPPLVTAHDAADGRRLGFEPEYACFAEDPGTETMDEVDCADAVYMRLAWGAVNVPEAVVLGSNDRPLGEPVEVAASGPLFTNRRLGLRAIAMGRPDLAVEPLEAARAEDADDVSVLYGLTLAYAQLGRFEDALEAAVSGLRFEGPQRSHLYELGGDAAARVGQIDRSLALLDEGLAEYPGDVALLVTRGRAHRLAEQYPEAEKWLILAARRDRTASAWTELAATMLMQDERSLGTMALVRARLQQIRSPQDFGNREQLVKMVNQPTVWPGGSALRGPLASVAPRRVVASDAEIAAHNVAYLIDQWAEAVEIGRKDAALAKSPWYDHVGGLFGAIVEADLVEAASWAVVSPPGEWPTALNVAVAKLTGLVAQYEANAAR